MPVKSYSSFLSLASRQPILGNSVLVLGFGIFRVLGLKRCVLDFISGGKHIGRLSHEIVGSSSSLSGCDYATEKGKDVDKKISREEGNRKNKTEK